jgi:hypothetical protein
MCRKLEYEAGLGHSVELWNLYYSVKWEGYGGGRLVIRRIYRTLPRRENFYKNLLQDSISWHRDLQKETFAYVSEVITPYGDVLHFYMFLYI